MNILCIHMHDNLVYPIISVRIFAFHLFAMSFTNLLLSRLRGDTHNIFALENKTGFIK